MAKLLSGTRVYGTATVDTQLFVSGSNSATSTTTGALQVVGGVGIGKDLWVGGLIHGTLAGDAGVSTTATNIAGGLANQIPYQTAPGVTSFINTGTAGQLLTSGVAGHPQWTDPAPTYSLATPTVAGVVFASATSASSHNVSLGYCAGNTTTTGGNSIALGYNALKRNAGGTCNIAVGTSALACNTEGVDNIAIGSYGLTNNTCGMSNIALGPYALMCNTTGCLNYAIGNLASWKNSTGSCNIALGNGALYGNTFGNHNISLGHFSMYNSIHGCNNIAIGSCALNNNACGDYNTAIGFAALACNTEFGQNVAVGMCALGIATGGSNIAIGSYAGSAITCGSGNVILGSYTGADIATEMNRVVLSDGSGGVKQAFSATGAVSFGGLCCFGTYGQVLTSHGLGAAPQWSTPVVSSTATHICGGMAGQIPYQTAPDTTAFFGPGLAGNILVGNGSDTPIFQNTLTLAGTTQSVNTSTGALQVKGGVGIGGDVYVGGDFHIVSTTSSTSSFSTNALFVEGGIGGNSGFNINGNGYLNGDLFVNGIITGTNVSLSTLIANSGTFYGDSTGNGALYAGIAGFTPFAQTMFQASGNLNNYMEINVQNINAGAQASTDIVASADNVTAGSAYIDMGITSSAWDGTQPYSLGTALGPNDGYIMVGRNSTVDVGDLVLGTTTTGTEIKFVVGAGGETITEADVSVVMLAAGTNASSTITGALQVVGGIGVGSDGFFGGNVTALSFVGNLTGVANTATLALTANTATLALTANTATLALNADVATTATNLAGGTAGAIPYQTSAGATSMLDVGLIDQILISDGTSAYWGYLGALSGDTSVNAITSGTASLSIDDTGVISLPVTGSIYDNVVSSTTTSVDQVLDSFAITSYRTVKYLIQAVDSTGVHSTEVTLMHDDTNLFVSQYNTLYSVAPLVTVAGAINTTTVSLLVTPANTDVTIDFVRIGLTARAAGGLQGDLMTQSGSVDLLTGSGSEDLMV